MTTFEDDFVRIQLARGLPVNVSCVKLGLEWPPPERLALVSRRGVVEGRDADELTDADLVSFDDLPTVYTRCSMSEITDEQRAGMTHVCRGAAYAQAIARVAEPVR